MAHPLILLTSHGTMLCSGPDGLYHVPLDAVTSADTPVMLDMFESTRVGRYERFLTRTNTPLIFSSLPGFPPGCEILLGPDRRTVTLQQNGRFYSAEPMNRPLAHDRSAAGLWETFLFVTEEDFAGIKHLFAHDWVVASSRQLARSALEGTNSFICTPKIAQYPPPFRGINIIGRTDSMFRTRSRELITSSDPCGTVSLAISASDRIPGPRSRARNGGPAPPIARLTVESLIRRRDRWSGSWIPPALTDIPETGDEARYFITFKERLPTFWRAERCDDASFREHRDDRLW